MEKREHRQFISRIHNTRQVSSLEQCLFGKSKISKSPDIRLLKRESIHLPEIIPRKVIREALRKRKCILDRQFHIRQSHLSLNASVFKLHHAMNNTLGVYEHLYLLRFQIE